jgi:putative membrane protein
MHRIAAPLMTIALWPSLSATPGLAQAYGDRDIWWSWGYGHMLFGGLMMTAFWGGVIALIVLLVRWLGGASGDSSGSGSRRTPLQILQERFAMGEIDKQEYEERKKLLAD